MELIRLCWNRSQHDWLNPFRTRHWSDFCLMIVTVIVVPSILITTLYGIALGSVVFLNTIIPISYWMVVATHYHARYRWEIFVGTPVPIRMDQKPIYEIMNWLEENYPEGSYRACTRNVFEFGSTHGHVHFRDIARVVEPNQFIVVFKYRSDATMAKLAIG